MNKYLIIAVCALFVSLYGNAATAAAASVAENPFMHQESQDHPNSSLGIHNGEEVPSFSSAPFMADLVVEKIVNKKKVLARCGAFFVKQNYLLTAAHCLLNAELIMPPLNDVFLYYGAVNLKKGVSTRAPLIRYSIFPGYIPSSKQNLGGYGDVAVIKLEKNASSIIQPLNIMPSNEALDYKNRITRNLVNVYGWGKKKYDQKFNTEKLQYMRVPIGGYYDIIKILFAAGVPSATFDRKTMLGTISNAGQVTDHGDSGGPMTAPCSLGAQCLLGIVKGNAGRAETLSIFTNVALTEKGDPNEENPVAIWVQEDINK